MTYRAEILKVLTNQPSGCMTYVIANWLRMDYRLKVETSAVLRELRRMEKEGLVKTVPTIYARQLQWSLA